MEEKNHIDIELPQEEAKGSYCNLSIITHSPNEFVIDFLKILPGIPKAIVTERVIMTPENTKRLAEAIAENVRKYEDKFGPIALHDSSEASNEIPIGFNNSKSKS